jgi:hypothetical protein
MLHSAESRETDSTALLHETIEAEPLFLKLIDFARSYILRDPELHLPTRTDFLDIAERQVATGGFRDSDDQNIWDELKAHPSLLREIEAFGGAILEEAFICLGEDAIEKVSELRLASNADQEEAVVNWLLRRIAHIDDVAAYDNPDSDDTPNYPPFQLSPRFIGQYPTINVSPTCLGKAILISSFFHKAGLPVLHGSVMRAKSQELSEQQAVLAAQYMTVAHPARIETLPKIKNIPLERPGHTGFHVASYIKLREAWLQVDPNYRENTYIAKEQSDILDQALHNPDLQTSTVESAIADIAAAIPNGEWQVNSQALEAIILNGPIEETYARIVQYVFAPFLSDQLPIALPNVNEKNISQSYNMQ